MGTHLLLILETTACVLFLVAFGLALRSLAEFHSSFTKALKEFLRNGKILTNDLEYNRSTIRVFNETLNHALKELADTNSDLEKQVINLDRHYHVSDMEAERDDLGKNLGEKERELESLYSDYNKLENRLNSVEEERENCERQLTDTQQKAAALEHQTAEYEACLPVVGANPVYQKVLAQCNLWTNDQTKLHYVFSRLAILIAIKNLAVQADDEPVMLRDAFNEFDKALYAQFMDNTEVLRQLRGCFEVELKPLLDGSLKFSWPNPSDALDLEKHKPNEENGEGVIKEVWNAILYTEAGELIHKATVST